MNTALGIIFDSLLFGGISLIGMFVAIVIIYIGMSLWERVGFWPNKFDK